MTKEFGGPFTPINIVVKMYHAAIDALLDNMQAHIQKGGSWQDFKYKVMQHRRIKLSNELAAIKGGPDR